MTGMGTGGESLLLAGDLGGTKTNLAVYAPEAGPHRPLLEMTLPSARYPSLQALVRDFLAQTGVTVASATFGVAGPVVDGTATITNLTWRMDEADLCRDLGLRAVTLLNDLESVAHAVPILEPSDIETINPGRPMKTGTIAVLAPGTGLGEAYLTWDGTHYRSYASEGGHADFAPTSPLELDLLRYLLGRFDHVSYERVCAGIGIPNLYAFLKDSGVAAEPDWLAAALAAAHDPTPVIVKAALAGLAGASEPNRTCALCTRTMDLFVDILAAQAGNLALTLLATGGVYLGGGIPPRILPLLQSGRFMPIFRHKGRFAALLGAVPVHVILNPKAALLGAARRGLEARLTL